VYVPGLKEADLIEATFAVIARDGADKIEAASRLMAAFRQIARSPIARRRCFWRKTRKSCG